MGKLGAYEENSSSKEKIPMPKTIQVPYPPSSTLACTCGSLIEMTMFNHPWYGSFVLGECERCKARFISTEDESFDPLYVATHLEGLIQFD